MQQEHLYPQMTAFKSLRLMAKFAKPIKAVLTPEEWGTVLSVLKGSRPHWNSIAGVEGVGFIELGQ